MLTCNIDGEEISRKYTPISPVCQQGCVEFLIKVYRPHPEELKDEEWNTK